MDKCPTCPYIGDICGQPTACPGPVPATERSNQPEEFCVYFTKREMKKIAYMARKASRTQERRNRPGDVQLLEGIEDKVQRSLLGI